MSMREAMLPNSIEPHDIGTIEGERPNVLSPGEREVFSDGGWVRGG